METLDSLSIESFSYSWLVNLKPSFESPKGSFGGTFDDFDFIEMDPKLSESQRFLVFHQEFDFNLPTLQPCVHADELISNGILVPLFLKPLDIDIYDSDSISNSNSNSNPTLSVCSTTLENQCSYQRNRSLLFRRYKRLPKRFVQKYTRLLRLIWLKMRRRRCESGELSTMESCGLNNWSRSCAFESGKNYMLSPTTSDPCSVENWRRSCDSESSINEAVLHCKKTIGCK